ncbi:MAG: hypothetical protein ACQEP6_03310 [Patescibacteria group bacterium]
MGLLKDLFGGGDGKSENAPKNRAEKDAARDYVTENIKTGEDPIPTKTPDWAKDAVPDAGQKK